MLILLALGCVRRGPTPSPPPSPGTGAAAVPPIQPDPIHDPVPALEQELRRDDTSVRERAALALWDLNTPSSLAAIDRLLRQPEDAAVHALLVSARLRRNLRYVEGITFAIQKGDPSLFPSLLEALPSFESEASAASLIALLRDQPLNSDAKRRAIAALGATRGPRATHALITRLTASKPGFLTRPGERDPLDEETLSALDRLTGWHFGTAEEWSRWWERHGSESREEWLEQALVAQRSALPPEEDAVLRRELLVLKNSQLEMLLDRAASTRNAADVRRLVGAAMIDPFPEHRVAAIEACRRLDSTLAPECLSALVDATHDKDERVRVAAVAQIGALGIEGGLPALRAAIGDVRAPVRAAAATALGKFAATDSTTALIERLGDIDPHVVAAAIESLGKIKAPEAAGPLLPFCGSEIDTVRRAAIFALGEIGDARAVDPLLTTLRHSDPQTRWWSASALGKLRDPRAVPALREALNDPTAAVRLGALDAIAKLAGPDATAACAAALAGDPDDAVRLRAAQRLGEIGDAPAVGALVAAVASANERVSATARSSLQQVATGSAPKAVISVTAALDAGQPRLAHELLARIAERHLFSSDAERALLDPLRVRTGRDLAGAQEWKLAQPWLMEARTRTPGDDGVLTSLLAVHRGLGERDRAITLCEEAVKSAAGTAGQWKWRVELARSLCDAGRFASARREIDRALVSANVPPETKKELESIRLRADEGVRQEDQRIAGLRSAVEKELTPLWGARAGEESRGADRLRAVFGQDAVPVCTALLRESSDPARAGTLCGLLRRLTGLELPLSTAELPPGELPRTLNLLADQCRQWYDEHRP